MRGVLIDLDGVVYQGNQLIPGAEQTIIWLQRNKIPHLFLTNTTSKPVAFIAEKLRLMGVDVLPHQILTPVIATVNWLRENGISTVELFVPEETRSDFSECHSSANAKNPEAVVIGDLGEAWDFSLLNTIFNLVMASERKLIIALGMTRYWRKDKSSLQLDVGPFVKALEYALSVDALVLGKPAKSFFQQACTTLSLPPEKMVMVGDDIRSDVDAAQNAGIAGVQVKTGKFRAGDLTIGIKPFAVIDSFADFPEWFMPLRS